MPDRQIEDAVLAFGAALKIRGALSADPENEVLRNDLLRAQQRFWRMCEGLSEPELDEVDRECAELEIEREG